MRKPTIHNPRKIAYRHYFHLLPWRYIFWECLLQLCLWWTWQGRSRTCFTQYLDLSTFEEKGTYNPPLEARQSRQWHRAHVAGYEDLGKEMVIAAQLQLPWMVSSVAIGDIVIYFLCCLVGGGT
jgi:hypothetical protein